jgi:hypothetical protein
LHTRFPLRHRRSRACGRACGGPTGGVHYARPGCRCEPASSCTYKFPKCEVNPGRKKWKQVSRLLSDQLGAFDDAFRHRKRCSEPDAGPYCIREAEGLEMLAEWGGLALTFLGGAICSVRAIETPGGDDDRQWLTFWMIMMIFFLMERFTDVLLSRLRFYYELKFLAVVWLMFFQGCARSPHTSYIRPARLLNGP